MDRTANADGPAHHKPSNFSRDNKDTRMTALAINTAFPAGRPQIASIEGHVAAISFGDLPFVAMLADSSLDLHSVAVHLSPDGQSRISPADRIASFALPAGEAMTEIARPRTGAEWEAYIMAAANQAMGDYAHATQRVLRALSLVVASQKDTSDVQLSVFRDDMLVYLPKQDRSLTLAGLGETSEIGRRASSIRHIGDKGVIVSEDRFLFTFDEREIARSGHQLLAVTQDLSAVARTAGVDEGPLLSAVALR